MPRGGVWHTVWWERGTSRGEAGAQARRLAAFISGGARGQDNMGTGDPMLEGEREKERERERKRERRRGGEEESRTPMVLI